MNVFQLPDRLVTDYGNYVRGFIHIQDEGIRQELETAFTEGFLWPDPLIQLNPSFELGEWIDELVDADVLHPECRRIFRIKNEPKGEGWALRLYKHQADAIKVADTPDIRRWLLGFAPDAEVVEPPGLREALRLQASALARTLIPGRRPARAIAALIRPSLRQMSTGRGRLNTKS